MKMKQLALTLVSFVAAIQLSAESNTGTITGVVLSEAGSPISGAKVNVVDTHKAFVGAVRYFETDDKGTFTIAGLPFGEYRVFAQKEEDGYPDMGAAFYSNNVFPIAILSESNPEANVVVQLPQKAGVLTGSVTDAVTGKPVNPVLLLRRAAQPKLFLAGSATANYRILVPSDAAVTLEIRAPGYIPWHYSGELRLKPNETRQLDVQLQPVGPPTKAPGESSKN